MKSFTFTVSSGSNTNLLIPDAHVGQYVVLDSSGHIVDVPQAEYDSAGGKGVGMFTGMLENGDWTAHAVVDDGVAMIIPRSFTFTPADLAGTTLFAAGDSPLSFVAPDGTKMEIEGTESESGGVSGLLYDFGGSMAEGLWTAFVSRGESSQKAEPPVIQYSADGITWHDEYDRENDKYMRMSFDGGETFTPETAIAQPSSSSEEEEEDLNPYTAGYVTEYYQVKSSGNDIVDKIISMVIPHIWMYLEIQVHYEVGARRRDGSYKFSYGNWNPKFEPEVFLNGSAKQLDPSAYSIDHEKGIIYPNYETADGDNMLCTYNFSWFRLATLVSYVERSLGTINHYGQGATTSYTVDTLPEAFYGISADLCVAMCMENLILGYTMWCGKLIFSISSNDLYNGGGGDIPSQLETIKRNAEDRAYGSLNNENTRAPMMLKRPTPAYWRAVTMGTGIRPGPHGGVAYGKLRGIKFNRMIGHTGPDLGI